MTDQHQPTQAIALDSMWNAELGEWPQAASELERLGYGATWTNETPHDAYLQALAAALGSEKMMIGTGIATGFTRSPMVTALTAWDLQKTSGGRFILGLGTQVAAHNARRYSTPVERPGAQMRELILALRHIWGAFQGEHRLDFKGRFYSLDLMTPMHSPGPIEHPRIPIYLAAVSPASFRRAGELADGVHVHSFHTARQLREISIPALEEGLRKSGRARDDVTLVCSLLAVIGGDAGMDRAARTQIAFYGSTSSYRPIFDLHGWGALTDQLKAAVRSGDTDAMAAAVDDEVLAEFAIVADDWQAASDQVRRRYAGLLDRVGFYGLHGLARRSEAAEIAAGFQLNPTKHHRDTEI